MNIQSGALTHHTCAKGLLDLLMYAAWDDAKFVETDLEAFPLRGTYAAQQRRKGGRFSHGDWVLRMAKRRQQYDTHRRLRVKVFCEKLAADGPGSQPEDFRVDRKMKDEAIFSRMPWLERQEWISEDVKAQFAEFCRLVDLAKGRQEHEEAKTESEKRRQEVQAKYRASPELQLLYDTVADAFAKPLNDLAKIYKKSLSDERLSREERLQLTGSLLPKWAPTSNGMHDKKTDIVRGIVERIFSPEEFMDPAGTYEDYVSRMKDKYRQEVLTPLRRATEVCEAFVGPQEWEKVNYNRMPARCRLLYGQNVFCKHDKDRYEAHLAAARENKATVKGNVMPHELVAKAWEASQACDPKDPSSALLEVEAQWADLVKEVKQAGHLGRCLAVCDVSCSMDGLPMEVAIALSLLVSEVAEEPWRNKVCSFSMEPSFLRIPPGASLAERTKIVEYMNWGMNTDFMKVFERMLEIAVDNNVPGNEMPETLLVFSDMQFDACVSSTVPWATLHEQIVQKFQSAGYGDSVPLIVYWNLRISPARGRFPVSAEQRGVVTLAGFSQGLLKSFLEHRIETVDPASQMRAMLDSEYFDSVQVAPEDAERQVEPSFASLLCESAST
ncbi:unnamed protein product [Effrenium voratum]|nr:unnamed protein product [Effrenium voratum]